MASTNNNHSLSSDFSAFQKKHHRLTLTIGILSIIGVVILPFTDKHVEPEPEPWLVFLGALHPILLHLPIGALSLVLFMEGISSITRRRSNATLGLLFTALSSIAALVFGYCLYLTGEFTGEMVESHKRDGILFTILVIVTFLIKNAADIYRTVWLLKLLYSIALIGTSAAMFTTGHRGGEITHGNPFDEAPWKNENNQTDLPPDNPIVYQHIVRPILQGKCFSCHGPKKQKSGLRMDSYQALLDGGEETDCLVPGDVKKSAMVSYLHLPMEDDLHMPPEGKSQLTKEEVQILVWWVSIGAPEKMTLANSNASQNILNAIASLVPEEIRQQRELARLNQQAEQKKLAQQQRSALQRKITAKVPAQLQPMIRFLSPRNCEVSFSSISLQKKFTDTDFNSLSCLEKHLVSLDLSHSSITGKTFKQLNLYPQLHTIRLAGTSVSNKQLDVLTQLPRLHTLSLHSTAIDEQSLGTLAQLPSLKNLYLWNTRISTESLKSFQAKHPSLRIIHSIQ